MYAVLKINKHLTIAIRRLLHHTAYCNSTSNAYCVITVTQVY